MNPQLTTARLRLRPPATGDAAHLAAHLDNFAVAGNLAHVPHPYSIADARSWLNSWRDDARPQETGFVIEHKQDGPVGAIGYHDRAGEAVIGYWLGEPFWGQGLMTEAMTEALDWYFSTTSADWVLSGVFHFNMASLAIQQKLGFVEVGRSEVYCLARGEDIEHIDTELTREAFEALGTRMARSRSA